MKSLIQPRGARGSATPSPVAAGDSVAFFRDAFLGHAPERHAVMLPPGAQRKYHEHPEPITHAQIRAHLAGQLTVAAPAAHGGRAALLPLDLDAGGLPALLGLLDLVAARGLWAFGQYCPRDWWAEDAQRGYVWLPFDELADAQQLQALGQELIAALPLPAKAEARAHAGETRLPLGRHRHTGRFGTLLLPGLQLPLDLDPAAALDALRRAWRPNPVASLPPLPPERPARPQGSSPPGPVDIDRYNAEHDLPALLVSYGARRAAGRVGRRLMHCCAHPDQRRASLLLLKRRSSDEWLCRCLSEHHTCPLSGQVRDAFGVYCALERLSPAEALRRLNGRG